VSRWSDTDSNYEHLPLKQRTLFHDTLLLPPDSLTDQQFYASVYQFTVEQWVHGDQLIPWTSTPLPWDRDPTENTLLHHINIRRLFSFVCEHGGYRQLCNGRYPDIWWSNIADSVGVLNDLTGKYSVISPQEAKVTYLRYLYAYEIYSATVRYLYWNKVFREGTITRRLHHYDPEVWAGGKMWSDLGQRCRWFLKLPEKFMKGYESELEGIQALVKNGQLDAAKKMAFDFPGFNWPPLPLINPEVNPVRVKTVHPEEGKNGGGTIGLSPYHPNDLESLEYDPPLDPKIAQMRIDILKRNREENRGRGKCTPPDREQQLLGMENEFVQEAATSVASSESWDGLDENFQHFRPKMGDYIEPLRWLPIKEEHMCLKTEYGTIEFKPAVHPPPETLMLSDMELNFGDYLSVYGIEYVKAVWVKKLEKEFHGIELYEKEGCPFRHLAPQDESTSNQWRAEQEKAGEEATMEEDKQLRTDKNLQDTSAISQGLDILTLGTPPLRSTSEHSLATIQDEFIQHFEDFDSETPRFPIDDIPDGPTWLRESVHMTQGERAEFKAQRRHAEEDYPDEMFQFDW